VFDGDIEEQSVDELFDNLEASQWLKALQTHSGERVPCFKDKQFVPATKFRKWPKMVGE
jgi:hypothetical protein